MDKDRRYDQVRQCLSEADRAFARASSSLDEAERTRLIEEAEAWLVRAERRLSRLIDRPASVAHPHALTPEERSFGTDRPGHRTLIWRRTPKA